jgi:hypothetical protein
MITSTQANLDNRIFSPHKLGYNPITVSELQSINTLSEVWQGTVSSDRDVLSMTRSSFVNVNVNDISIQFYTGNYRDLEGTMILVRQRIVQQPFRSQFGVIAVTHDPYKRLAQQDFSKIYSCGTVSAFIK